MQPRWKQPCARPDQAEEEAGDGAFVRGLAVRMVFVALLAMAATASGLLFYDQSQPTSQTNLADRPALAESPALAIAAVAEGPKGPSNSAPSPLVSRPSPLVPHPTPLAPQDQPPQPAPDPQKRAAFREAMSQARAVAAKRDFAAARRHLKQAETNAQDPTDQAELGRLDALVGNLEEFWKGMRTIVSRLLPAEEIILGQTPIIVVRVDADQLTMRSEGRNQTYRLYDLPRPIVEALAARGFAKDPSSKVLLGTYMAMDPHGDRQRARQLWEQAAREGEDVRELMPEISAEGPGTRGGQ